MPELIFAKVKKWDFSTSKIFKEHHFYRTPPSGCLVSLNIQRKLSDFWNLKVSKYTKYTSTEI